MKKQLTIFVLMAFSLALVIVGCGSDNKSTGSLNDQQIANLEDQTSMMVYSMQAAIETGMTYAGIFQAYAKPAKPADSSYSAYDSTTGWWYYYYQNSYVVNGDTLFDYTSADSVRLFDDIGDFQQYYSVYTDSLQLKMYYQTSTNSTTDSIAYQYDVDYLMDADYGGFMGDTISIDGDYDYSVDGITNAISFNYAYQSTYNQVKFLKSYSSNIHPFTGSMSIDLSIEDYNSDQTYNATIIITFSANGYHGEMVLNGDTYTWDATWTEVDTWSGYWGGN